MNTGTNREPHPLPLGGARGNAGYRGTVASRAERSMSFGAIAGDYDRLRPDPPPEAVDWLLPARRDVVVDLAAGTGKLTRALAGKVRHIVAVEPDDRMRSVLRSRSGDVEVLPGRGESIPLPDASVDAVFVSSAWHWMDPELAAPEIARVLRGGGRFGMLWTGRERDIGWLHENEWFREARAEREPDTDRARPPEPEGQAERRTPSGAARQVRLPDSAPFINIETAVFRFSRYLPVADVVDLLATYSGIITASRRAQEAGKARAAAALAEQFPGAAELPVPMASRCWRADRLPRVSSVD